MIAFHGDPKIKSKYLARVRAHREADELIHGIGWKKGRGCAIGCTLDNYDHSRYPIELGIPEILARLEDRIFEGLPVSAAQSWPERFLSAITPGADLSLVWPRFVIWLLETELFRWASPESRGVCDLFRRQIAGDVTSLAEWGKARSAVYAAAADADADADAARTAAYGRMSEKLIGLLKGERGR